MAVTDRPPVRVLAALRPDDVIDYFVHQLGQHPEPDSHAQREQSFLRSPNKLAQRLPHASGQRSLLHGRGLRDRYLAWMAGLTAFILFEELTLIGRETLWPAAGLAFAAVVVAAGG